MTTPLTAAQPAPRTDASAVLRDAGAGAPADRAMTGLAMGAVMLAALVVVSPAFFFGGASGHDIAFHLTSWMDAAREWQHGVLYPRWAAWANYGYGEARFIFYPPLSWMLGAALGSILPWKLVAGTFLWLALTAAGASMFALARAWLPPASAARAAFFYAVNPYHLLLVYLRSDFAELLVSAAFPLVVLYALRLASPAKPAPWPFLARRIVPLAIVFAVVWLSNAPAAVVTTYSLALMVAVVALLRRSPRVLFAGGVAMALGLLLAAVYIVPAMVEQSWVKISEALSSGLRPEENFLFTMVDDPEHNRFNLLVSTIAVAALLLTTVAAGVALPARRRARELWWALLLLAAAASVLMLRVTSFAWRHLPEMRFVQFPWRWLIPLGAAFAVFAAAAIERTRVRLFWTLLLAAFLAAMGTYLVHVAWWDTQDVHEAEAAIPSELRAAKGYEGTDEYQTLGADHYDLPQGAPLVALQPGPNALPPVPGQPLGRLHVERWAPEEKILAVDARAPVVVALRLLNYPAWRVDVNGERAEAESQENTGQMLIELPAGSSRVRAHFARTADRTFGGALSFAAMIGLFFLARAGRRAL